LGFVFILTVTAINFYSYPDMFDADWKLWFAAFLLPIFGLGVGYLEGDVIDLLSCSLLPRFFIITKVILHAIVNNTNIRRLKSAKIRGNITIFEASSIL
jgi:hypothetical protein